MLWSPALFRFKVQSAQLFWAPLCMIQQPTEPNPYNLLSAPVFVISFSFLVSLVIPTENYNVLSFLLLFPEQKQELTINLSEDKISIVNFYTATLRDCDMYLSGSWVTSMYMTSLGLETLRLCLTRDVPSCIMQGNCMNTIPYSPQLINSL